MSSLSDQRKEHTSRSAPQGNPFDSNGWWKDRSLTRKQQKRKNTHSPRHTTMYRRDRNFCYRKYLRLSRGCGDDFNRSIYWDFLFELERIRIGYALILSSTNVTATIRTNPYNKPFIESGFPIILKPNIGFNWKISDLMIIWIYEWSFARSCGARFLVMIQTKVYASMRRFLREVSSRSWMTVWYFSLVLHIFFSKLWCSKQDNIE